MLILKSPAQAEFTVKKSRFLSEVTPVDSPAAARALWQERKRLYDNGGHIVYAFITGSGGEQMGCSDDGEPSGTAGRPVLAVLKGAGVTNVVLTVARWFGGVKLGTGGLVHAYSEAAQRVLAEAVLTEFTTMRSVAFTVPYFLYEAVRQELGKVQFEPSREDFGEVVTVAGVLPEVRFPTLRAALRDLSNGRIELDG